jgi:hypothetical protein
MPESIFSKSLKTSSKTYFFDVKQAQNGKQSKYMQVTESRIKDGQPLRSSITIFPDQLQAFLEAFEETREKVQ